jgi:hypothetical protein
MVIQVRRKSESSLRISACVRDRRATVERTFHEELAVVAERMTKLRKASKPLRGPFPRTIRPSASPFRLAPGVSYPDEALTYSSEPTLASKVRSRTGHLHSAQDRVGVTRDKT